MLSIGLCDDEEAELSRLEGLVKDWGRRRRAPLRLKPFGSGEELLGALGGGERFDVVFLDVYMGPANGVEVARALRSFDQDCCIVFATNSRGHAIDGYGVRALQYLLKPLGEAAVEKALDQALDQIARRRERFVLLRNKQGSYRIPYREIAYVESKARLFVVHRPSQEDLEFYGRLDDLEAELADPRFLRCHKSFIVNLDYARAIEGGEFILEGGAALRISMKLSEAKSRFASYLARDL